jgi:hypothetical protein
VNGVLRSFVPHDTGPWVVVQTKEQGVHVLPVLDSGDYAAGHDAVITCPACRPEPLRDGSLDEPVWSHYEPTWPGANDARRLDA